MPDVEIPNRFLDWNDPHWVKKFAAGGGNDWGRGFSIELWDWCNSTGVEMSNHWRDFDHRSVAGVEIRMPRRLRSWPEG